MKKTKALGFLLIVFLYCCGLISISAQDCRAASGSDAAKAKKTTAAAKAVQKKTAKVAGKKADAKQKRKLIAYYFHGTARCASCRAIEAYSAEAIQKAFDKELKEGTLEWKPVNVEEKGNEHFVQDYKLYTKSLILSEVLGGKQTSWKNLDKVWELLRDKDAFEKYVQDEVRACLAEK